MAAPAGSVGDIVFAAAARISGGFVLVLLGSIIVSLFIGGLPAFQHFGVGFIASADWDPSSRYSVPPYRFMARWSLRCSRWFSRCRLLSA